MKPLQFSDDPNFLELVDLISLIAEKSEDIDYKVLAQKLLNYTGNLKEDNFEKCQQIKESLLPNLSENEEDKVFEMPF